MNSVTNRWWLRWQHSKVFLAVQFFEQHSSTIRKRPSGPGKVQLTWASSSLCHHLVIRAALVESQIFLLPSEYEFSR